MTIENIIYLVLGFLLASFIAIIAMPSIWKRAVRLTKKRIEAATPMTMAEFRADKDQLRAGFALTLRGYERNIESLRTRLTGQLAELNEAKTDLAVSEGERDRLRAINEELEARIETSADRLRELEREITDLSQKLRGREREIIELRKNGAIPARRDITEQDGPVEEAANSIRDNLARNTAALTAQADNISAAYTRISDAGSNLSALLDEHANAAAGRSLAETLSQEDALEDLHGEIQSVETEISDHWAEGSADKDRLRETLQTIASKVSGIVYAAEGDKADAQEQSLFDRISKFAGDALDDSPQAEKQRQNRKTKAAAGTTLSDRMAAFQDLQTNN